MKKPVSSIVELAKKAKSKPRARTFLSNLSDDTVRQLMELRDAYRCREITTDCNALLRQVVTPHLGIKIAESTFRRFMNEPE